MHFVLTCPSKSQVLDQTPENKGFKREDLIRSLEELRARGHDYEVDGDAISDEQRGDFYRQAFLAVVHSGNRYRIRQVFGSRRRGGGDFLGTGVPALIVFENGDAVDVYPHQVGDGYATIVDYLAEV
jgi:hypothetical protein